MFKVRVIHTNVQNEIQAMPKKNTAAPNTRPIA